MKIKFICLFVLLLFADKVSGLLKQLPAKGQNAKSRRLIDLEAPLNGNVIRSVIKIRNQVDNLRSTLTQQKHMIAEWERVSGIAKETKNRAQQVLNQLRQKVGQVRAKLTILT